MTITVLLPAYNAVETILPALQSICAQSFSDFECLVIDDGSTDGTLDRIRSLSDARIRLIARSHGGLVATLNAGLEQARGEFIARMDADDVCHPERFARQLELLRADPGLAAVGCGVRMFPDEQVAAGMRHYLSWLNSLVTPAQIAANIFVEMPLLHPAMMIRTSALRAIGGYRAGEFPEDYDMLLRLHAAGWKFANVAQILFEWREHPRRLSRTHPAYSPAAFRRLKADFLARLVLADRPEFAFWGVGRDGKKFIRELLRLGFTPRRFIDIDPKKIGSRYHGVPILSPEHGVSPDALILVCVGARGAREEIRAFLQQRGMREGSDFLFLA